MGMIEKVNKVVNVVNSVQETASKAVDTVNGVKETTERAADREQLRKEIERDRLDQEDAFWWINKQQEDLVKIVQEQEELLSQLDAGDAFIVNEKTKEVRSKALSIRREATEWFWQLENMRADIKAKARAEEHWRREADREDAKARAEAENRRLEAEAKLAEAEAKKMEATAKCKEAKGGIVKSLAIAGGALGVAAISSGAAIHCSHVASGTELVANGLWTSTGKSMIPKFNDISRIIFTPKV
jgi:hypothetical protein